MLGFAFKRFDGAVPSCGDLPAADQEIIARTEAGFDAVGGLIADVRLKDALEETLALARAVNGWLNERAPWQSIKVDREDAACAVYAALRCIDNLKTLFAPFTPFSSQQVHEMLGYDGQLFGEQRIEEYAEETRSHLALIYDGSGAIGAWKASRLPAGQSLRKPSPLFVKLDADIVEQRTGVSGAGAGGEPHQLALSQSRHYPIQTGFLRESTMLRIVHSSSHGTCEFIGHERWPELIRKGRTMKVKDPLVWSSQ